MTTSSAVAEQYVKYPYPGAGDDIPTWLQTCNYNFHDPRIHAALFWPEGPPRRNLNILVAGCGTMQAAVIAFTNPGCSVTGIDFSTNSIEHEQRLRDRHSLNNLTLRVMDLLDIASLGKSYDFILCSGVLHHLPDPASGLRALASVLDPVHGAMVLMLYGRAGRVGIYLLQDAFRRMGITQTPEGVRRVRTIISRLPPRHPGRLYYEYSLEMSVDAAIVDTFLHRQDQAFSVDDLLDLVERNGLVFQNWLDSAQYNDWEGLDEHILGRERWCIVENLSVAIPTHHFIVCRPERRELSQISFQDDQWLDYFPLAHPTYGPSLFEQGKLSRDAIGNSGRREYKLTPDEMILFMGANGKKAIRKILDHRDLRKMKVGERNGFARQFYERMWQFSNMYFSKVPVKMD